MKTVVEPLPRQQFLELDADWEFYEALLEKLGGRPIFVTYDRGMIEVMSPSRKHEVCGRLIARMIDALTEELGIPIASGGSMTFKRKDLERGLEPDECYWIQNAARMAGMREIDLAGDPPPDLAIEIEISRRLLDRESIYAQLGIPEIWRYDGRRLRIQRLVSGRYRDRAKSAALPQLSPAVVDRFLRLAEKTDETSVIRAFRQWVRDEHVARGARRKRRP